MTLDRLLLLADYDANGVREGRVEFIARRYLRGWFAIDFVSCIPVDYITMAMESNAAGEGEKSNFRVSSQATRCFL